MSEATKPLQPLKTAKDMHAFLERLDHFKLLTKPAEHGYSYLWDNGLLLACWGNVKIALCTNPSAKLRYDEKEGAFAVKPPDELVLVWECQSCHTEAGWVRPGLWQQGVELWVAEKLKLLNRLQAEDDEKKRIHDAELDAKLLKVWSRL